MSIDHEQDLPGVRQAFRDAIQALIGRTRTLIARDDGTTEPAWADPLLDQLRDYVAGAQGSGSSGAFHRSMPPVVLDAVDLSDQINRSVKTWVSPIYVSDTLGRLEWMEQQQWRPQDVPRLRDRTADLTWWAARIRELLDPPRRWTIPAPCPQCDTSTVYRKDSAGETVRQPALQIGAYGCECQHCRQFWPPEHFGILAAAIGIEREEAS